MTAFPLISVLVRTRDRKSLLLDAIASVTAQQYRPIELVIVNDHGENFSDQLPSNSETLTLRWLENKGTGRSAAANTALDAAAGEFALFLDDDDWLDPQHLGRLYTALEAHQEVQLAYSGVRTVHEDGTLNEQSFDHPFDATRLLAENYIPIHAVLFSRKLIDLGLRFDTTLDRYEDWDFWLQALGHSQFLHLPGCTANYRINTTQSGFGAKEEASQNEQRAQFYQKWLPRLNQEQTLALLDRSRAYPHIAVLRAQLKDTQHFIEHLQQHEKQLLTDMDEQRIQALYEIQSIMNQVQHEQSVVAALKNDLNMVLGSRSWKITRPLRLLTRVAYLLKLEGVSGVSRRIFHKLVHKTPQLPDAHTTMPTVSSVRPLRFTPCEQPEISIVIPVFNKHEYTFHCLQSILTNSAAERYEVIVVDDCSTDATAAMLKKMEGITVVTNATNSGFIHSCNAGAAQAKGKFLVLFNNDTEAQPGWLSALRQTFIDCPDAGMVGAKLLYPDGSLQEAGGIVWQDGSAWNYGRNGDPNNPEFSYLREADYCSGACLMIALDFFKQLGMFDTVYVPAYYEDTDLAFKVRAAGKKVYYQPNARIIHFEGITCGTDASGGVKEYQLINRDTFLERWQEQLATHRPNGRLPMLEKERSVKKRILVIDARILMPDHDSGSLRMFNLLKILQQLGYKVTFIPDNLQYHEHYTPMLQALGIECWYAPYINNLEEHLSYFGNQYQAVMLSRADVAEKHIDNVLRLCPRARILFDTVDLHFLREERQAQLSGSKGQLEGAQLRKIQELSIARKAHTTIVVSPVELELFRQEAPDVRLALVSNIHASHGLSAGYAERSDILFIGSFEHPPNVDAMHFFIDEVFPLLHRASPQIRVLIVGKGAPSSLKNKARPGIEFTGFVSDIAPLFNTIRLSIAPLRYGAGVKGKINSSMSFGVPVIATTVAAEGMGLTNEENVLIADAAADFSAAILRAYNDETLWNKLSAAGLANIEECFSFDLAQAQLRAIIDKD